MKRRPRSHAWPLLELVRLDAHPAVLRAGAVGRGHYVAIDVCGETIKFYYLDDPVVCPKCRREYEIRQVPKG